MADEEGEVRRRVALKIIKLGMDTKSVVARFEQERQALALMDHPNIAKVLGAGTTESGRPYFVMEYVTGDRIIEFADAHRLSVKDRLELFVQVCQAVQHAHTKGIIHRDIKPSNVLVSMIDGRPMAKVIDFGIAKATGARLTEKTLFTEHRQLIGTPEYMSPEQAEGSADIDTRTDVYGLGVLLYELLTGLTPFDAERLRSAAFGEMQRIIKEEDPPSPSLRVSRNLETLAATAAARQVEPARLGTLMRGELDWIVMKSLEKDRARRYGTASALAEDVRRHLEGEAVDAAPASAGYRVRKFVRKHKAGVVTTVLVGAALVVGIAGTTWQWREARHSQTALEEQLIENREAFSSVAEAAERAAADGGGSGIDPDHPMPGMTFRADGFSYTPPSGGSVAMMRDTAVWYIEDAARARKKLEAANAELERTTYGYLIRDAFDSWQANNFDVAKGLLASCPPESRGWEWQYVYDLADVRSCIIHAHSGPVAALAFGSAPGLLASAGEDRTVDIWDAEKDVDKPRLVIHEHPKPVRSIAFTPDDELCLTVCGDQSVRMWDVGSGKLLRHLQADSTVFNAVVISRDGAWCAAAGDDRSIHLWNPHSGEPIGKLVGHNTAVTALAISPRSGLLVSGDAGGTLRMWDMRSRTPIEDGTQQVGGNDPFPIRWIAFDEDGTVIVGPSPRGGGPSTQEAPTIASRTLGLPDIREYTSLAYASDDRGGIQAFQTARSGYYWIGGGGQPNPGFNPEEGKLPQPPASRGVAVSRDGRWAAMGRDDGTIDVRRGWHGHIPRAMRLIWNEMPNTEYGSYECHNGVLFGYEGSHVEILPLKPDSPWIGASFTFPGWMLEAVSEDAGRILLVDDTAKGEAMVVDARSQQIVSKWHDIRGQACLTPDGHLVADAIKSTIRVRDAVTGNSVRMIALDLGNNSEITHLRISGDGQYIAYGTENRGGSGKWNLQSGEVGIVDLATGEHLWQAGDFHPTEYSQDTLYPPIQSLHFDRSSKKLAVAGSQTLSVFKVVDGMLIASAHSPSIEDMVFSSNGEQVFTMHSTEGGWRHFVCAWRTFDLLKVLEWPCEKGGSLALSPDGTALLIAGSQLWTIPLTSRSDCTAIDRSLFPYLQVADTVRELSATAADWSAVTSAIDASEAFEPAQKELARQLMPNELVESRRVAARDVAMKSNRLQEDYVESLRSARFSASAFLNDPPSLITLGMALFRNQSYEEAIQSISRAIELDHGGHPQLWFSEPEDDRLDPGFSDGRNSRFCSERPYTYAFLAMSHFKLGHVAEAHAALDRLKDLMAKPEFANDVDRKALYEEAKTLIEGSEATQAATRPTVSP
ncbi:MAG TPA: protein kinase [Phycisphaerales bacterium]|nr:protein kinase [Phycisphaerales bacterium]